MEMSHIKKMLEAIIEMPGHHLFKLKNEYNNHSWYHEGWMEGYIIAIDNDDIVFSYAPSPFMESDKDWELEYRIPINSIDIESLRRNFN